MRTSARFGPEAWSLRMASDPWFWLGAPRVRYVSATTGTVASSSADRAAPPELRSPRGGSETHAELEVTARTVLMATSRRSAILPPPCTPARLAPPPSRRRAPAQFTTLLALLRGDGDAEALARRAQEVAAALKAAPPAKETAKTAT